jgi:hypothetical protein
LFNFSHPAIDGLENAIGDFSTPLLSSLPEVEIESIIDNSSNAYDDEKDG